MQLQGENLFERLGTKISFKLYSIKQCALWNKAGIKKIKDTRILNRISVNFPIIKLSKLCILLIF